MAKQEGMAGAWKGCLEPWLPLLVAAVAALVYLPVVGHEFLSYDDLLNVVDNSYVLRLNSDNLARVWSAPLHKLYIPLTYTLWSVMAQASQFLLPRADGLIQPVIFHGVNLLCHLAATLLVFALLTRLVTDRWAAALGALLFALHPVQVEAVAWVTGFKDLLCGLLGLLALLGYAAACQVPGGGRRRAGLYVLATLAFTAALLAKPSAVTLPLAAACLGYFFLGQGGRRLLGELGPWLLLALPLALVAAGQQGESGQGFVPNFWQRLIIAGDSISFYLYKLFLPLRLGPDYMRSPQWLFSRQGWLFTGTLPYLLALAMLWRYRRPWLTGAAGVFAAALLPMLGLVSFTFQEVSTVSDRYLYLAMLGPALAAAWLLARCPRRAGWVAASLLLAALALKSADQVWHWEDSATFYQEAVEVNPRSYTAYNNLGVVYKKLKRGAEAMAAYRRAIAIEPRFAEAYANIAQLYREQGRTAEAISWFKQALLVKPDYAGAYANLGDLYKEEQRPAEALAAYNKAVTIMPGLARVHAHLGLLHQEQGELAQAAAAYRQAIKHQPDFAEAHNNLGALLQERREYEPALNSFRQAIALNPNFAEAHNNLGFLLCLLGRDSEAVACLRKAIELSPNHPLPYNNLARAYLHLHQIAPAREYADLAKRHGYLDPQLAQTLAGIPN